MNCFVSLFNKYLKRCDMRVCNMISVSFVQYVNFPLLARSFLRLFLFHNNETQRNFFVLNNKDTSDSHVYAYLCVYICAYVCITIYAYVRINIRICAYNHMRMCVYSYTYVGIKRVCAVNVYLSGTVDRSLYVIPSPLMLSPHFIPQSVFHTQSLVCSPHSALHVLYYWKPMILDHVNRHICSPCFILTRYLS